MITTASKLGVKSAIHLNENNTANLLNHVTPHSIEHGTNMCPDKLHLMALKNVYWVPTLAAYYTNRASPTSRWEQTILTFKEALRVKDLKITCGGDTGVFPHGENSLEMKLMVSLGADPKTVLQWCTLRGWECVRGLDWEGEEGAERIKNIPNLKEDMRVTGDNDMPFGVLAKGFAADIIATGYDLETNFDKAVDATGISFVMKAGKIYKLDGKELLI
jgi:imidazolonepropionase-like amidohydrolase